MRTYKEAPSFEYIKGKGQVYRGEHLTFDARHESVYVSDGRMSEVQDIKGIDIDAGKNVIFLRKEAEHAVRIEPQYVIPANRIFDCIRREILSETKRQKAGFSEVLECKIVKEDDLVVEW